MRPGGLSSPSVGILWLRVAFMLGLALRPGCQCLGPCSSGSFSLASRFDARGILGQGWCSTHDQQHSPWFVRVDIRGLNVLNIPPTHILRVGYARRSEKGWYFHGTQVSCPVLMALPLLPVIFTMHVRQFQGFRAMVFGGMIPLSGSAFSTQRITCMRVSDGEGVKVKVKRIDGLIWQHAARSPLVSKCLASPRAVVLTRNRYPMHTDRCAFGSMDFGSEWWSLAFVSALLACWMPVASLFRAGAATTDSGAPPYPSFMHIYIHVFIFSSLESSAAMLM